MRFLSPDTESTRPSPIFSQCFQVSDGQFSVCTGLLVIMFEGSSLSLARLPAFPSLYFPDSLAWPLVLREVDPREVDTVRT